MKTSTFRFKIFRRVKLTFAARFFDLSFQFHHQVANARLVYRLDQSQCFVENASLMFGPVWLAGNTAQFAVVKRHPWRSHHFSDVFQNRKRHRRNTRELN